MGDQSVQWVLGQAAAVVVLIAVVWLTYWSGRMVPKASVDRLEEVIEDLKASQERALADLKAAYEQALTRIEARCQSQVEQERRNHEAALAREVTRADRMEGLVLSSLKAAERAAGAAEKVTNARGST